MNNLEDIIRQYIDLHSGSKDWLMTRCSVCDDHHPDSSNFKGFRAGFKFEGNGAVGYNCFNCGHAAKYDPDVSEGFSKNMKMVFKSFNIPEEETNKILFNSLGSIKKKQLKPIQSKIEPKEIKMPDHFYPLSIADKNDKWKIIAEHYLKSRLIDPDSHPFYLSTGEGKFGKKWKGRVIIPIYKTGKLIYFMGRDLTGKMIKKYQTPSTDKSTILYGFDEIFKYEDTPLFVTEGFFDAKLLNGIAIFGKYLTDEQITWINRSKRRKIVIPDKYGDGKRLGLSAIKNNWEISTPEFGECGDVTDAMLHFGELYVIDSIMKNTHKGFSAKLNLELYCK